ncbi:MAG: glycosyltransferase [Bacteroidetes bacterium]|nr:glycosyltransferase [Bacteroidota bacterium]
MKVGIYIGETTAELGGGYRFIDNILNALVTLNDPQHHFVLFHYGVIGERYKDCLHIETHRLPGRLSYNGITGSGILKASSYAFNRFMAYAGLKDPPKTVLQKAVDTSGAQIMWYPTMDFEEVDIPYVYNVLDIQHLIQPYFPEVSAKGEWERRESMFGTAIRKASFLLTGTQAGKDQLVDLYHVAEQRIRFLKHPVPELLADKAIDVRKKWQLDKPFIFYPAQFWSHKNHVMLLEMLRYIKVEKQIVIQAVFSGSDKGNMDHVRTWAHNLGVIDQVRFTGFVEMNELIAFYKEALCLTYPSYFGPENFPPLEAAELSCPVIAADVPGAREQIGDFSILLEPSDQKLWGETVYRLATDKDFAEDRKKKLVIGNPYYFKDYLNDIVSILKEFEPIRRNWP